MKTSPAIRSNLTPEAALVNRYMMLCTSKCSSCFRKNVAKMPCGLTANKEFGKCWVRGALDSIEATIGKEAIAERFEKEMKTLLVAA